MEKQGVNKDGSANLEDALAEAGLGWYNLRYCIAAGICVIVGVAEPMGYSYVLPAAKCDLNITDAQRGLIASLPYLGVVLTSFMWGYLADTQGRKRMIVFSTLTAGCLGIISAFMPEVISFIVFKFLASLCIACPAAVPYTYIGEILPHKYRDIVIAQTNAILGSSLLPLMAWLILPTDFRIDFGLYDFRPWRLLSLVYSCFFLIGGGFLAFGPESPKYLVAQGRHDEALEVLRKIYAGNKGKSPEDYPVKSIIMPELANKEKSNFFKSLVVQSVPLLKPPYFKWLALNGVLLFGLFSMVNGLYIWVPDILNRVFSGNTEGTPCQIIAQRLNETITLGVCNDTIDTSIYLVTFLSSLVCGAIGIMASSTVRLIGKKTLLFIVYFVIGLFCILVNFSTQKILVGALLPSIAMSAVGVGPINSYAMETFPTHLRGMAACIAMMVGRVGSIVGTNVTAVLINSACVVTFYMFGGFFFFCGLLTFLLPKSTQARTDLNAETGSQPKYTQREFS